MKNAQILVMAVVASFLLSAVPFAAAQEVEDATLAQKYRTAKEDYLKAKDDYLKARQTFVKARTAYKDERGTVKLKLAVEAGKKFLEGGRKHVARYLNALSNKVEASKVLEESEKTAVLAELDGYVKYFEEQQAKIEAAATKDEVQTISKEVKAKWEEVKPATKVIVGKLLNARIQYTINTAKEIAATAQTKIDALKADGKDTTKLEALLAEFNTLVATAQEKHDTAKTAYADVNNLKEADKLLREAHVAIKQGNGKLKELAGQIRALQGGTSDESKAKEEPKTEDTAETTPAGSEAGATQ